MGISAEIKGDKLILTVDVSEATRKLAQPSKTSGALLMVGTTGGFTMVGDLKVNVMVGVPNPGYVKTK